MREHHLAMLLCGLHQTQGDLQCGHAPATVVVQRLAADDPVVELHEFCTALDQARGTNQVDIMHSLVVVYVQAMPRMADVTTVAARDDQSGVMRSPGGRSGLAESDQFHAAPDALI